MRSDAPHARVRRHEELRRRVLHPRTALVAPAPSPPIPLIVGGRAAARELLAAGMQSLYQMPFEPFERYSPYGSPADVAAFLSEYLDAGCKVFNVIPCAQDHETAVAAVGEPLIRSSAPMEVSR